MIGLLLLVGVAAEYDSSLLQVVTRQEPPSGVTSINDTWGHGLRWANWGQGPHGNSPFQEDWYQLIQNWIKPGSIAVDIGAHTGDTVLPISLATKGGTTVAFEMSYPYPVLKFNAELNPQLNIRVYNKAVTNNFTEVPYQSACNGCNGGIPGRSNYGMIAPTMHTAQGVRLLPFLQQEGLPVENISFIKIDTEGHDMVILRDLKTSGFLEITRPVIYTEWFAFFEKKNQPNKCSDESRDLFQAIADIGYVPYKGDTSYTPIPSCANKHYMMNILLLPRDHPVVQHQHQLS